jgi:hypothetical protein
LLGIVKGCGIAFRTLVKADHAIAIPDAARGTVQDGIPWQKIEGRISMRRRAKRSEAESNPAAPPYADAPAGRDRDAGTVVDGSADSATNGKPKNGKRVPVAAEPDVSFWDLLANLGEDKWASGNYQVRIYRVWPIIERRQPDGVFLAIAKEPLDEAYLLERFGSGRYLLLFKHFNKLLRKFTVTVNHPEMPPKVDESEILRDDPANAKYFQAWAKRKSDGAADGEKSDKAPVTASETNTVLNTVLDKAGSFDPKLAELWETTALQRDELSKALAAKNAPPDFATQAKALKEVFPQLFQPVAASSPASVQQLDALALLKAMKDLQPDLPDPPDPLAVMERAQKLFAPQAATTSPLSTVKETLGSVRPGAGVDPT